MLSEAEIQDQGWARCIERLLGYGAAPLSSDGVPWLNGNRFISLLDMISYPVWQLGLLLTRLKDLEWTASAVSSRGARDAPVDAEILEDLNRRLSYSRRHCETLELRAAVERI